MFTIPCVFFILWRMIEVSGVHFAYRSDDGSGRVKQVLHGVDMHIDKGSYVAVLGPNGSGKSTLAKLIDVLEFPEKGSITVFGFDTSDSSRFWQIRENCACVFQNPDNQIVGTVVEEDVAFGPENMGIPNPELRERVDDALKDTGLYTFRRRQAASLSGGQKQKLAIAGALAMRPEILILDESTAMLDPISRSEFLHLVEDMRERKGLTVITITHDMNEACRCEKIFVVKDGRIEASGTPLEIFSNGELIRNAGLDIPVHYSFINSVSKILKTPIPAGMTINSSTEAAAAAAGMIREACPIKGSKTSITPVRRDLSDETVLEIHDLDFGYEEGGFKLDHIDLEVKRAEILAIVGRSGCGKTTLVSHLNALISPKPGQVLIHKNGEVLDASDKKELMKIRSTVGLVFQYPEYQLFEETVYKDVAYGLKRMGVPQEEQDARIREAVSLVGLDDSVLERSPFELSGGQKRRAAMAGVLVMKPEILVLDEPASGLDPRGRREMFKIIKDLRKNGTTVIIVTHNMDEAASHADRICCLSNGRILAVESPEELFSDYRRCKEAGIDIPRLTSFSRRVRNILRESMPDLEVKEISFDPEEAAGILINAVSETAGGSHAK